MISEDEIKFSARKIPVVNNHLEGHPKNIRAFRPKIDLKVCQNNYNCIIFCPHDAIDKNQNQRPAVDYDICTGCLICLRECPTNAISEEREVR